MLAVERRLKILERVAESQNVEVSVLARQFGVSEMTVRRDMQRLERDGFLRRTYGGATAHQIRSIEVGFNARILHHAAEKRLIGSAAAKMIDSVKVLFLGFGTTAEQLARYLPVRRDLTVITPSLAIASLLGTRSIDTIIVGGHVRQDELSCVGPLAIDGVRRYNTDLAVIGAAGISCRRGVSELDDNEAEVIREALDHTEQVMVISDGSKFGATSLSTVTGISRVNTIVTDVSAPKEELREIRATGVAVVVVTSPSSELATLDNPSRSAP
jgi:DeoR family transcriptional regulator of aga operon/DeoR family fructose operon transcriptional repressor